MAELTIDVEWDPVRVIPVPVTTVDVQAIAGPCKLCGWSLRDATGELNGSGEGSVTSPGAAATIATTALLPKGIYDVSWQVGLQGTLAAGDANNFQLLIGGSVVEGSVNPAVAGNYPQAGVRFSTFGSATFKINAIAAGTVGAIYLAQIEVVPSSVDPTVIEIQDGNNVLGESGMVPGGADTHWFGGDGLKVRNEVFLHVVSGAVTGAIYARFQKLTG